jgi:hypothetical protein
MPSASSGTIKPALPKNAHAFFGKAGYGKNTPAYAVVFLLLSMLT